MKKLRVKRFIFLIFVFASILVQRAAADDLDVAIRKASDYLNSLTTLDPPSLTKGSKVAIFNIQSDYPVLSEYIIDELISNTVNDGIFPVVNRQDLETIRNEAHYQNVSGEVDNDTAVQTGQYLGAQTVIIGNVYSINGKYRLRIRALEVGHGIIQGQNEWDIPESPLIALIAADQKKQVVKPPPDYSTLLYILGGAAVLGGLILSTFIPSLNPNSNITQ